MRVVSLVPSLTEAVAETAPGLLVGATDYCTHPAGLDVPRVGGSKYPSIERILALRPDLVLLNVEENRRADADALRAAGVPVWVCYPRTLDEAFADLRRLVADLGMAAPSWLTAAEAAWSAPASSQRYTAVVPVWRRPWVVLGSGTFAGDVLARLGVSNVYGDAPELDDSGSARLTPRGDPEPSYPRPPLAEMLARKPDLVVLPDEPYAFTATDGPEAFPGVPAALVSGRHLTWYGPSLAQARDVLSAQLAAGLAG